MKCTKKIEFLNQNETVVISVMGVIRVTYYIPRRVLYVTIASTRIYMMLDLEPYISEIRRNVASYYLSTSKMEDYLSEFLSVLLLYNIILIIYNVA